jgi:hypothetical protein
MGPGSSIPNRRNPLAEILIAREDGQPNALCPNCQEKLELPPLPG